MMARRLLWTALLLMTPVSLYADEAEERALKMIQRFGAEGYPLRWAPGQPILSVSLGYAKVTNADLKELAGLKDLEFLGLFSAPAVAGVSGHWRRWRISRRCGWPKPV